MLDLEGTWDKKVNSKGNSNDNLSQSKKAHALTQNLAASWSSRGRGAKALFRVFKICSGEKQQVLSEKENQIQSEKRNYHNFTKKEGFGGYVMSERDSKPWIRNIMLFFGLYHI